MHLSSTSYNPSPSFNTLSSSFSPCVSFLYLQTINSFKTLNLKTSCSSTSYQTEEEPKRVKKKQKLRPNFYEQVRDKWSVKLESQRKKFPWQVQEEEEVENLKEEEEECVECSEENEETPMLDDHVSLSLRNHLSSAPWVSRTSLTKPQFVSKPENVVNEFRKVSKSLRGVSYFNGEYKSRNELGERSSTSEICEESRKGASNIDGEFEEEERIERISSSSVEVSECPSGLTEEKREEFDEEFDDSSEEGGSFLGFSTKDDSIELPWESRNDSVDGRKNESRAAGVTQALVDRIHEKWREEEVVKLKFEGPPAFNMRRTHDTLETRTGGLVIWRSGSSLVLYRGMTYMLACVQQYSKLTQANRNVTSPFKNSTTDVVDNRGLNDAANSQGSLCTRAAKSYKDTSKELMAMGKLNDLLDELGPRFVDWSGPEPLPVDADLLPSLIPGYTPPFRILPYRVRPVLGNTRTTLYRRLARTMPPHFALGRSRELQGLAIAMVKLWERNAIAKIAIKRGVLNTNNERMAEELKKLTGGTLLSRNKEYIVFYRGNDFLSPPVTEVLLERQKLVEVQQEEEEIARDRASTLFVLKAKAAKGPLVAGTLAETLAAKSCWGNEPSCEDLEKMKREFALVRHASLVRYFEKKLARAQDKVKKAEKALRKVQEFLNPTELPCDLETITDEERVLFRKMGLSMKPFLLVGRREVFDGTVENMHLHWKHRELVKIIVRGRNFPQAKHIAISLEAESGGILISVDKTTKGYAIVFYRGKNYQRPRAIRPKNLLTKRQALARSIELQRREALIHHISDLHERIELLRSGLDQVEDAKEVGEELQTKLEGICLSDDDFEDEGEEVYMQTYNNGDEEEGTTIQEPH
ncbi:hypothetical protein IFM89_038220 [Coptis chinensis]|uniref:CRM domain-containing protein n=1 Tax=Coptis chinensis TaxID=261450 RepID=A0A835IEY4_9MAGN|nr:hypothetical protein IFM89_038220 [Coptis chinensis]